MTFVKGQSGNPKGRPKRKTFRDYWSDIEIEELVKRVKFTYKKRPDIMKLAFEQIFGKAPQSINIAGQEDKPLPILFKLEATPTAQEPKAIKAPTMIESPKDDVDVPSD